jgi:large subunit ribosomal protein L15
MIRREKKSRKLRGWRSHGWGSVGQHRDRGSQGGRPVGMSKEKWSWAVKYGRSWYGKKGFVNPTRASPKVITLRQFVQMIEGSRITPINEGGETVYDLAALGYGKLIGGSKIQSKLTVRVPSLSERARQRIEEVGGKVILTE